MARVTVRDQMLAAVKNSTVRSAQLMKEVGAHGERRASEGGKDDADEETKSIFSPETIRYSWPSLSRAGFGVDQVRQLEKILREKGVTPSKLAVSLDHAEWEVENGKMLDKQGAPVADPCAWVFQSLARFGYYRRPAGYVSPEEQMEQDAAEGARNLALVLDTLRNAKP